MKIKYIILIAFFITIKISAANNNLVQNPSFDRSFQYWNRLWTRTSSSGSDTIHNDKKRGPVLKIVHSGTKDWSFSQSAILESVADDIYELSAYLKNEKMEGRSELSVVTYDKNKKVNRWFYGKINSFSEHNWKFFKAKFIVPADCHYIQLRITGHGPGTSYWDNVSLIKKGSINNKKLKLTRPVIISRSGLKLTYQPKSNKILIYKKNKSKAYQINGLGEKAILTGKRKLARHKLQLDFFNLQGKPIKAIIEIKNKNDIYLSILGKGKLDNDFEFPGNILAKDNQSWILPINQGLLIPATDPHFKIHALNLYSGHGLCMPFLGLTNGRQGIIIIARTPDDGIVKYFGRDDTASNGKISFSFKWQPSFGKWQYQRKLKIKLIDKGGYVAIAKAYRRHAKRKVLLVTLKQKSKKVPAVKKLIGAVNLWWWKKAEWWQRDLDCEKIAAEIKASGIGRVLWSNRANPAAIKTMNKMGFLTGRYDIYQDVWPESAPLPWVKKEGWTTGWPEDLVLWPDGKWRTGWVTRYQGKEYPGGIVCSKQCLEHLYQRTGQELLTHPYQARFIDTTTASPLYECYHPQHKLSRSNDKKHKFNLLNAVSNKYRLVTGSETGIDWAVPAVHYFEGMMSLTPYRLPDAGYDLISYKKPQPDLLRFQVGHYYRIPLFELVYHDCVVSYWYWGDSSNRLPEIWDQRDLFNVLYGTPPLWIVDPDIWRKHKDRFIQSYNNATPTAFKTGFSEMKMHKFLTDDHTVQYTEYSNKTKVWVNFGDNDYRLKDGRIVKGKGFIVE